MNNEPISPEEAAPVADEPRREPIPMPRRLPPDQMLRPWRTVMNTPPRLEPADDFDDDELEEYERLPRWTWQRVVFILIILFALLAFLLYTFSGLLIPPSDFPPTPTRPLDFT